MKPRRSRWTATPDALGVPHEDPERSGRQLRSLSRSSRTGERSERRARVDLMAIPAGHNQREALALPPWNTVITAAQKYLKRITCWSPERCCRGEAAAKGRGVSKCWSVTSAATPRNCRKTSLSPVIRAEPELQPRAAAPATTSSAELPRVAALLDVDRISEIVRGGRPTQPKASTIRR